MAHHVQVYSNDGVGWILINVIYASHSYFCQVGNPTGMSQPLQYESYKKMISHVKTPLV